jgi:predicted glycosyl hydrolase (DUF1957 family)
VSTQGTQASNGPSSSTTEQAKEKAQETVQQAAGQARGQVRSQVDQRSTQAGEQISTVVGDVRSVGEELRKQGKDQPAKLAERAASEAEKVGDYLKRADADAILRDVEDFGRKQPWAVIAGGLAAGFLASRFLKASSSRRYSQYESSDRLPARRSDVTPPPGIATPAAPPVGTGATTPPRDVSISGGVMPAGSPGQTFGR